MKKITIKNNEKGLVFKNNTLIKVIDAGTHWFFFGEKVQVYNVYHQFAEIEEGIFEHNLLENKVLLFLLEPGKIDKNIAGLVANKFMAKYQRPCCILTKVEEDNPLFLDSESFIKYQGSARNYDKSGILNFKDI